VLAYENGIGAQLETALFTAQRPLHRLKVTRERNDLVKESVRHDDVASRTNRARGSVHAQLLLTINVFFSWDIFHGHKWEISNGRQQRLT
jgi:hypothetical protein